MLRLVEHKLVRNSNRSIKYQSACPARDLFLLSLIFTFAYVRREWNETKRNNITNSARERLICKRRVASYTTHTDERTHTPVHTFKREAWTRSNVSINSNKTYSRENIWHVYEECGAALICAISCDCTAREPPPIALGPSPSSDMCCRTRLFKTNGSLCYEAKLSTKIFILTQNIPLT